MKILTSLLLSVAILYVFIVNESSGRRHRGDVNKKLAVTLYYEALCPYCRKFVIQQLNPSMKRRLPYTELKLVPYGNAKQSENGTITCQHGEEECSLNAWHGCILENLKLAKSLPLISCMMRKKNNVLDNCAKRLKVDVSKVKNCKNTQNVDDILAKYANETAKVSFKGVPAIAVDNIFNEADEYNLIEQFDKTFCIKYKAKFKKELKNCTF